MANNNEQNRVNREVNENGLDLTLRLGVEDSRTQPNPSQNRANYGLGFGMMAGENSNPLPNVGSGSNDLRIGSSNTVPLPNVGSGYNNLRIGSSNNVPVIASNINQAANGNYVPLSPSDYILMVVSVVARNIPGFVRRWNGSNNNNSNSNNNHNNNNNNHREVNIVVDIEMTVQADIPDLAPQNSNSVLANQHVEHAAPDNLNPAPEDYDDDSSDEYIEYTDDDEVSSDDNNNNDLTYEEMLRIQQMIGNVRTGLSERTIEAKLMRYIYPFYSIGPNHCCICQEDFTWGEMIGFLECMHDDFHFRCIKRWLRQKNECPLCKAIAIPVDD